MDGEVSQGRSGEDGSAGNFYALQHILQDCALLPGIGEDVCAWCCMTPIGTGHHKAYTEPTALRTAAAALLSHIPSAPAVLGRLQTRQGELPEGERRQVALPEATHHPEITQTLIETLRPVARSDGLSVMRKSAGR